MRERAETSSDRELALSALQKRRAGRKPTASAAAALRRYEQQQEEETRWRHYETIPKRHYCEMSGRQVKILNEQARQYGAPIGGPIINLREHLKWLHDWLAKNAFIFAAAQQGGDGSMASRYLRAKVFEREAVAEGARLRVDRDKREVVGRGEYEAGLLAVVRLAVDSIGELAAAWCATVPPEQGFKVEQLAETIREELAARVEALGSDGEHEPLAAGGNGHVVQPEPARQAPKRRRGRAAATGQDQRQPGKQPAAECAARAG